MKQETLSDALLRKFLLGKVDEEEQERIERLFLIDPEVKQRVLLAEHELIEDYLDNSLMSADREIFLSVYAQTAEQQRRLRIIESIKKSAATDAASRVSAKTVRWSNFRERLWLRPNLLIRTALTVAVVIVIAVIWLNSPTRQQHLIIEQELAQLNVPASLREVPSQMVSLDLSPIMLRSAEHKVEWKKTAGVQVVELRLPSLQKERFSAYEAEIQRLGDDVAFTIRNLQAESDGRYVIRIRLPAEILRGGQYQIRLSGIPKNGVTEEYQFIVRG